MSDHIHAQIRGVSGGQVAVGSGISQTVHAPQTAGTKEGYCMVSLFEVATTLQLVLSCNGRIMMFLKSGQLLFDDGTIVELGERARTWEIAEITGSTNFSVEFGDKWYVRILKNGQISIANPQDQQVYPPPVSQ